jgi:integrase
MGRGQGVRADSASSITIDFYFRGIRCRPKLKLAPTPANRRYAERLKAQILNEIALGTFDFAKHFPDHPHARRLAREPAQVVTVGELLTEWMQAAKAELEPETYGDYRETVDNVWRRELGQLPLAQLTLARVQRWVGEQTVSRKRILNVLTPLRQAVRYAVNTAALLPADPLANLVVRRPEGILEERIDPFTPAEIQAICRALDPPLANLVQFWAWTGVRFGELVAVTWADIDLERGVAAVTKSRRGRRLKAPKTRSGRREVRLLPPAVAALKAQAAHTRLIGREVFLDPRTQQPWIGDKPVRVLWQAALAAAGVRYRFPRQCRHTFASWMLSAGESPLWVARQLGHADWSMIVKVYGRWIPAVDPEAGMRAYRAITSA